MTTKQKPKTVEQLQKNGKALIDTLLREHYDEIQAAHDKGIKLQDGDEEKLKCEKVIYFWLDILNQIVDAFELGFDERVYKLYGMDDDLVPAEYKQGEF